MMKPGDKAGEQDVSSLGDQTESHHLYGSEAMIFAAASNQMHASSDIPSIMRAAVRAGMLLVNASKGASGLCMDGSMLFSEYSDSHDWHAAQWGFEAEQLVLGNLITHRQALIISHPGSIGSPVAGVESHVPAVDHLIAIPVPGKENDLLACLLFFDKQGDIPFDSQDQRMLEQLASMMSVAIENNIQLAESRRVEADLEKSVATYRTLVEQIPAITYIATLDRGRILFVSPQINGVLGFSQDDFLSNQEIWSQQIHPDDHDRVLAEVRLSLKSDIPFHSEYRIRSKDGRDIWVEDAASKVRDQDQDLYLQGVIYDITDRKEVEHRLVHMAHYDQLTGLANRVLFHDRLEQVLAHSKRQQQQFALLYLDLDGFKAVNDDLGHQIGDLLLAETARRLKAHVREVDTVARMGGDEFTIILDNMHTRQAVELVARKLVAAVSEPYEHVDANHTVTVSVGIAMYPDDSMDAAVLVTSADHTMYKAKNSGKNSYCFYQA